VKLYTIRLQPLCCSGSRYSSREERQGSVSGEASAAPASWPPPLLGRLLLKRLGSEVRQDLVILLIVNARMSLTAETYCNQAFNQSSHRRQAPASGSDFHENSSSVCLARLPFQRQVGHTVIHQHSRIQSQTRRWGLLPNFAGQKNVEIHNGPKSRRRHMTVSGFEAAYPGLEI
jgi:hypothetical protein